MAPARDRTGHASHQACIAALDELAYRNQRGRFPVEQVRDALDAAFPLLLRDFLDSDDARDVTGSWGFTTTTGDEFRAQLLALLDTGGGR